MPNRTLIRPNRPDNREIEECLLNKLEAAKSGYEQVSQQYKRAIKHCEELALKVPHLPDGDGDGYLPPTIELTVSQAIKAQYEAFKNYRLKLEQFNNFLLYGELPGATRLNSPQKSKQHTISATSHHLWHCPVSSRNRRHFRVNGTDKTAVALRILTAINNKQEPDPKDIARLVWDRRASAPRYGQSRNPDKRPNSLLWPGTG